MRVTIHPASSIGGRGGPPRPADVLNEYPDTIERPRSWFDSSELAHGEAILFCLVVPMSKSVRRSRRPSSRQRSIATRRTIRPVRAATNGIDVVRSRLTGPEEREVVGRPMENESACFSKIGKGRAARHAALQHRSKPGLGCVGHLLWSCPHVTLLTALRIAACNKGARSSESHAPWSRTGNAFSYPHPLFLSPPLRNNVRKLRPA